MILITGAGGGLGSNVLRAAVARGVSVRALVRDAGRLHAPGGTEIVAGDARDHATVARAADGCSAIFHLANVNISQDWIRTTAELLDATLTACAKSGARLVFPANVWVFGPGAPGKKLAENEPYAPSSAMGRARQTKEERIRSSGIRFVAIRLPEFYGPHVQTLTGPPLLRISQRRTGTWFGPGNVEVEFVYMPDAAEALLTIGLADGVDGEVFHFPGASAITPRAFFALAREVAGGGDLRCLPAWFVKVAATVNAPARAFADILHLWTNPILLDGAKLSARFPAIRPTPYRDGLEKTIDWLRQNPKTRMYY